MKLSEAIRLGAMATVQGFGADSIFSDDAPCALGAARLAAGIQQPSESIVFPELMRHWPVLAKRTSCPECRKHDEVAIGTVWHLNDEHKWSRERIADWVESIEPQDVPASLPLSEEPVGVSREI